MGLVTIDPHSQNSTPRFTKSPSLVLIGLVLTEIQAFKNVKKLQRNVWKCGKIRTLYIYIAPPCEPVASPDILKELIDLTLTVTN